MVGCGGGSRSGVRCCGGVKSLAMSKLEIKKFLENADRIVPSLRISLKHEHCQYA